jgi:DNA-binding IclR family transcriptional regulator
MSVTRSARQALPAHRPEYVHNLATARVMRILSAFLDSPKPLGISELSRSLGMTKSMVSRGVSTLLRNDYLVRDESGSRYKLGFAIASFGALAAQPPDIHRLVRPALEQLHWLTGVSTNLHIPIGEQIVCIDGIEGTGPTARRVPLGRSLPIHVAPPGRAILAYTPQDEVERYLSRPLLAINDTTLTNPERIREEIARVRELGYAEGIGELVPRSVASAVAFPVLDMNFEPHGAITVTGPIDAFPRTRMTELLPQMQAIVETIGRLGRTTISNREPIP